MVRAMFRELLSREPSPRELLSRELLHLCAVAGL